MGPETYWFPEYFTCNELAKVRHWDTARGIRSDLAFSQLSQKSLRTPNLRAQSSKNTCASHQVQLADVSEICLNALSAAAKVNSISDSVCTVEMNAASKGEGA